MARKRSYNETIRDHVATVVADRQIENVLHFTQLQNLPAILRHGLLPRKQACQIEEEVFVSSRDRLDKEDDVVSVSISCYYPKMFEAKRYRSDRQLWTILGLHPSVLWNHRCRFFAQGVATNAVKYDRGTKNGGYAFEKLFEDVSFLENEPSFRDACEIPRGWPTFPDAEVQVMGPIDPGYIKGVWVETPDQGDWVRTSLGAAGRDDCEVVIHLFEPRLCYKSYRWG